MRNLTTSTRALWILLVTVVTAVPAVSQQKTVWALPPHYETAIPSGGQKPFSIVDSDGIEHIFYTESHAILIIEGAYSGGGWTPVSDVGAKNERLLREVLEKRGFHVLIWRDLKSDQLKLVLNQAFSSLGYKQNTRLFFYYFGHGKSMEEDIDVRASRTFLVPTDAPDPALQEEEFFQKAFPISQLVEYAKQIRVRHAFFALESCRAGAVIASLGGLDLPHPIGYLLSDQIKAPVKYFLTAGTADKDITALNSFTPLLAAAMSEADFNSDGFVTGAEVIGFVTQSVPQVDPNQNPEHGSYPATGGGDIIFGRSDPSKIQVIPALPKPAPSTVVLREWQLPGLNVGCNETKEGRVEASVSLDPRLQEHVVSVSASLRDTSNIANQQGPTVQSAPGPKVVVAYRFDGLKRDFIGNCPGGGHATLVVTFSIERTVPSGAQ